jgi:hypothetical protein
MPCGGALKSGVLVLNRGGYWVIPTLISGMGGGLMANPPLPPRVPPPSSEALLWAGFENCSPRGNMGRGAGGGGGNATAKHVFTALQSTQ